MRLLRWLPRFRDSARAMPALRAREGWSRGEVEAFQLGRLNALWDHARRHVPYYRDLAARRALPVRWADLGEFAATMPLLRREHLQGREKQFLSEQHGPGYWGRTGGSTGEPLSVYWGRDAHAENLRCRDRHLAAWGVDPLDRTVYLWGHAASFLPGWQGWWARVRRPWLDWLRGRLRLSAYKLGPEDLREHLRRLGRFRPTVLYSYSTAAALLAEAARADGFSCPSLKLAILTAEPAYPHLVRAVEEGLAVPAVVEYGSMECGVIASEGPDRILRAHEDRILLETLPSDDGRHDIVVTPLGSAAFPLIRYAIGDTTDRPLARPERGFAALHNVGGRANDLLRTRTGRVVHSTALDVLLEFVGGDGVLRYAARQRADGSVDLVVQTEPGGPDVPVQMIRQKLEQLLEGYPVQVALARSLPQTAAGKHRWISSEMATNQTLRPDSREDS